MQIQNQNWNNLLNFLEVKKSQQLGQVFMCIMVGIIRKPEKCVSSVSKNSRVTLHYRARVWGNEEYYESTFSSEPHTYKLGNYLFDLHIRMFLIIVI